MNKNGQSRRNKFLQTSTLPRPNQVENRNRPITSNEVESEIYKKKKKNLPNSPGPHVFSGEFYQYLQKT